MTNEVNNHQDIIDSRDVIARIEELRDEEADLSPSASDELAEWREDYAAELKVLESLAEEAAGYSADWTYGATLIRDSYFEDYARQFADDIGAINADAGWPNSCIDWERAADELKMDYTSVDFDGVTYWVL